MEKKTSIHFEPCNIQKSEKHNKREQELDYIFPELTKNNESKIYVSDLVQRFNQCQKLYEEKVGQKMQKKTVPLREGVVVIDEHTTMDDLEVLANEIRLELGWQPLQIHIHRDEGYVLSGDNKGGSTVAKLNLHAHIVFDCQDKQTGKMFKNTKLQMSRVQTLTAQTLRMQRGQASDRKHLKSLEYKIQQNEERIKQQKLQQQAIADSIRKLDEQEKQKIAEFSAKLAEFLEEGDKAKRNYHFYKNGVELLEKRHNMTHQELKEEIEDILEKAQRRSHKRGF